MNVNATILRAQNASDGGKDINVLSSARRGHRDNAAGYGSYHERLALSSSHSERVADFLVYFETRIDGRKIYAFKFRGVCNRVTNTLLIMLYSEKVTLMNLLKKNDHTALRYQTARFGISVADIQGWILATTPSMYYEDYDEQLDADRWSDRTAIFTEDGKYADSADFRDGDILMLAEMPFDKDGHKATGFAIWSQAAAGNYCWQNEYED